MIDSESQDLVRDLDPFGFLIGHASAIRSLGGAERGPDPRYVFHTPYVAIRPGRAIFTIRFQHLRASFGELRVHIHAFVPGSGRDAIFVTSTRLDLADKIAADRPLVIPILGVAGATYAAYGICLDGTDAQATELGITIEEVISEGPTTDALLLPTQFGTGALEMPFRLVGDESISLRDPVSQPMTENQLAEPEYHQWASMLRGTGDDSRLSWQLAFIAQVLDRYGMLQPGARGIALGQDAAALAPIVLASKCDTMFASIPTQLDTTAIAWNSVPCSPIDAVPGPDGLPPGALLAIGDQPADQRGFDFLWSIGLAGQGYAAGNTTHCLIEAMTVLRPGGYAVHMLDLATAAAAPPDALPRAELERTAIRLISRGYAVAQLNFARDGGIAQPAAPFGLIVRKD